MDAVNDISDLIAKLEKFGPRVQHPEDYVDVTIEAVSQLREVLGCSIPGWYVQFLQKFGCCYFETVPWIEFLRPPTKSMIAPVDLFYGINKGGLVGFDLRICAAGMQDFMPRYFIPVALNGSAWNAYYCLALAGPHEHAVYYLNGYDAYALVERGCDADEVPDFMYLVRPTFREFILGLHPRPDLD